MGPDGPRQRGEIHFADAPGLAPLHITFDAQGDLVEAVSLRWTDANPREDLPSATLWRANAGNGLNQGFRIPVRAEMGNMFGSPDYASFFLATITRAEF